MIHDEVMVERKRQIAKGFDAEHDDQHTRGELTLFAAAVITVPVMDANAPVPAIALPWPDEAANHAIAKHSPRQRLIIAMALLQAEVERLDRLEPPK